ncbi:25S rRNA (adenine645-N1)-methyltransferase [Neophaeococcomyces mojaviensis]|uniref:25S rRNA (Adenine645-N1)-methyltransferase n=1 Tax=Neophaeococcomyces mojaviensis TaxID=3383035 RepID=A0ACC3A4K8_9EURO|nr:25S rRNA (adenine645-N1)-methyltransferase [Knufia sp. JES_112]
MFTVPGWNIAAKTPVQEQAKPVRDQSQKPAANDKKRKRDPGAQKQGPATTSTPSKPQEPPSNGATAENPKKKHKPSYRDPTAEHSKSDYSAVQKSGKSSRKLEKATGANAAPIGRIAGEGTRAGHARQDEPRRGNNKKEKKKSKNVVNDSAAIDEVETTNVQDAPKARSTVPVPPAAPPPPTANLTPLQAKMRAKLTSARFRHLNETLYTTSSSDAFQLFTNSPDLFAEYHAGFSQQVQDSWPQNPVDVYITTLKKRGSLGAASSSCLPLPRRKPGICTIADLGCGDAPLARGLQSVTKRLNLKLHNFDLHAPNNHVTKADISALPLHDGEADIALFCLSLMGTNWLSFVEEAWRILRGDGKGEVWVAEVKSRFARLSTRQGPGKVVENSVGKRRKPQAAGKKSRAEEDADSNDNPTVVEDEREATNPGADDDTDLGPFINAFQRRGFTLREGSIDKSNRMFVSMVFTKFGVPRGGKWKGMKWNGKEYQRMEERRGAQQRRSHGGQGATQEDDEIDEKDEGKLLKPCVYKLR